MEGLKGLMDKLSPGDILTVDGVSKERDENGMYSWMNILVRDCDDNEFIYHLEGNELTENTLADIWEHAWNKDVYIPHGT